MLELFYRFYEITVPLYIRTSASADLGILRFWNQSSQVLRDNCTNEQCLMLYHQTAQVEEGSFTVRGLVLSDIFFFFCQFTSKSLMLISGSILEELKTRLSSYFPDGSKGT